MRLDGLRIKHQLLDFVLLVLFDARLGGGSDGGSARERRNARGAVRVLVRAPDPAVDVLFGRRRNLIVCRGDELNAQIDQRHGRVGVVGDDQAQRREVLLVVFDLGLRHLRFGERLDGDGQVLVLVCLVQRVGGSRPSGSRGEVFGDRDGCEQRESKESPTHAHTISGFVPYVLYNLALYTALLLGLPVWAVLLATRKKWRSGIWERLGGVPQRLREPVRSSVWVHAVSVGEVLAAVPLVKRLEVAHDVYVSTTTKTGQELARQRFSAERVFYFPADFGWAVRAYMRRVRPSLVVMMETEFWPNFLRIAQEHARVAVVNARISDRSFPGYKRWGWLVRPVLRNVDAFFAQSREDARRLVAIGGAADRVQVAGNLKFDWSPPTSEPEIVARLREAIASEGLFPVIVAGSTVEGEEAMVARAFRAVAEKHELAMCVLAPRHPERFDEVTAELERAGMSVVRGSDWHHEALAGKVLLLDSIGELAS